MFVSPAQRFATVVWSYVNATSLLAVDPFPFAIEVLAGRRLAFGLWLEQSICRPDYALYSNAWKREDRKI